MGDMADDARDWELTHPRPRPPKRRTIVVPVVGITFVDAYPHNIHKLRDAMSFCQAAQEITDQEYEGMPHSERRRIGEGPAVVLKRNPDNPHDRNAIEVHVPALGVDAMIGHVGREHAARWAPKLDAGETPRCWVESVRVKEGHEDRPGIDIRTEWGPPEGDTDDYWTGRGPGRQIRGQIRQDLNREADDEPSATYAPGSEPDDGVTLADARAAGFATVEQAREAWEEWQIEARNRGAW